ncbi:MAG: CPBP family intramembrane metalloprotease [Lentisphaeria bacterium]|nr:CPBP family intramembrane metalloprotease [Lentisphaeria bacterium]
MTFFSKSWSTDCSVTTLCGILAGIFAVYVYPLPLFAPRDNTVQLLLFQLLCSAVTAVWTIWMFNLSTPAGKLPEKLGISMPGKKSILHTLSFLPLLLVGVAAITMHWKYTLRKLEIPFEEQQEMLKLVSFDSISQVSLLILLVVMIVPFLEELIFRRILFDLFARSTGYNGAAFLSAGVFSAAHGFAAGAPALFLMGLAFQWIYSRSRNLACAVLLHSLCNLFAVAVMVISKTGTGI